MGGLPSLLPVGARARAGNGRHNKNDKGTEVARAWCWPDSVLIIRGFHIDIVGAGSDAFENPTAKSQTALFFYFTDRLGEFALAGNSTLFTYSTAL